MPAGFQIYVVHYRDAFQKPRALRVLAESPEFARAYAARDNFLRLRDIHSVTPAGGVTALRRAA